MVHSGVVAGILSLGLASFGVAGLVRTNVLAKGPEPIGVETAFAARPSAPKAFNYSRPDGAGEFAANSGGPVLDVMLTEEEMENADSDQIAAAVRAIATNADPAFVPTMWAHLGKINNEFGFRRNPFGGRSYEFHAGMDIDGEKGDQVMAPANGTIIKAGWTGGYGNMIEIDHGNGLTTRYGHLSKIEVQVGDTISRGQLIALVGSTGRSTGPHLHYELRLNDKSVNPRLLLPPEPTDLKQPVETK